MIKQRFVNTVCISIVADISPPPEMLDNCYFRKGEVRHANSKTKSFYTLSATVLLEQMQNQQQQQQSRNSLPRPGQFFILLFNNHKLKFYTAWVEFSEEMRTIGDTRYWYPVTLNPGNSLWHPKRKTIRSEFLSRNSLCRH